MENQRIIRDGCSRWTAAAAAFVDEVGVCSTFYRFPEGVACLWEAVVA